MDADQFLASGPALPTTNPSVEEGLRPGARRWWTASTDGAPSGSGGRFGPTDARGPGHPDHPGPTLSFPEPRQGRAEVSASA
jgi:hypothetical protein